MQVNKINQTNFNGKITILDKDNRHKPLLYNELLQISRKNKLPAFFMTHSIEFPNVSNDIIAQIKNLGIKISTPKKAK